MKEEGIQEGLQKGRQEGLQEGKLENQKEVIIALYDGKIPVQSIAKYTKLSIKDIIKILMEHNKIKE
jgi:predicted transposase/invertase (TIGR01784 family)